MFTLVLVNLVIILSKMSLQAMMVQHDLTGIVYHHRIRIKQILTQQQTKLKCCYRVSLKNVSYWQLFICNPSSMFLPNLVTFISMEDIRGDPFRSTGELCTSPVDEH